MGSIFDIPQQRLLVRCKDTPIALAPDGSTFSTNDNSQYWFGSTNYRFDHTGRMDVLVKCTDPATQFPLSTGTPNVGFGFVLPANQCLLPIFGTDVFYGISSIARSGADDYRMACRSGLPSTANPNSIGITDAQWVTGVVLTVIVTNRFVTWLVNGVAMASTGFAAGPYSETPSGYVANGGPFPPQSSRFRFSSGRAILREQLTPMIFIKTVTTIRLLGASQGEAPDTSVPVQP